MRQMTSGPAAFRFRSAVRPEDHLIYECICSPYLRAAQAYMLISMPTGTSAIFGAFQAILALRLGGCPPLCPPGYCGKKSSAKLFCDEIWRILLRCKTLL